MVLRLLIDAVHPDETRVAIVDNGRINDFDFVTSAKKQVKGNIYLAKITRVEPSLQAAFVEYGSGKQGFLPFAEIHPDYYQIPVADRERLLREAENTEEKETSEPIAEEPQFVQQPVVQTEPEPEEIFLKSEEKIIAELSNSPTTYSEPVAEASEPELVKEEAQEQAQSANGHVEEVPQSPETETIETLASEEEAVQQARPKSFYRRYKIQEVIKRNQIVLVQVIKEERGNKGVSLTTYISLAGRYCVLMPNSPKGGGISRKISSGEDRRRLKEISAEFKTVRGMSAIIRTAGIDRSRNEIQRDYEYLVKLWETIREQTLSSSAPALIYEEGDIIKRTIRDLYTSDIEEVIVAGEAGYEQAKNFLNMILPETEVNVKLYQNNVPLFHAYNIEDQLNSMYDQSVKLRSGGYIVLNPTEALISIDVNSGRSTGERNIEETATKTNLEAAYEIARQVRLRDLAGLIVIDFIDMADSRNRRSVERALRDALKVDRAKIQLGRISAFGLLEMSRQRLRPSISETSTSTCPHCQGKGVIRSSSSVALQLIRTLEKEAASGVTAELKYFVATPVALDLLNHRKAALSAIEEKYSIRITAIVDDTIPLSNFRIEKVKGNKNQQQNTAQTPVSMNQSIIDAVPLTQEATPAAEQDNEIPEMPQVFSDERPRRRRGRGRRGNRNFGDRGDRNYNDPQQSNNENAPEQVSAENESSENSNSNNNPQPRGERGGRRRNRRWRDKREHRHQQEGGNRDASSNDSSSQATRQDSASYQPSAPRIVTSSPVPPPPPLEQQAPQDGKPKKGWWRRIVES